MAGKKQTRSFQGQPSTIELTSLQSGRLGAGQLAQVMNGKVPWIKIPTFYYDYKHLCLPLTTEECAEVFAEGEIPIFNTSTTPNRFTNATIGSSVNETFLALGAGVLAIGEGESFSIHGARVAMPAAQTATPVIQTLNAGGCEIYCGSVNLSNSAVGSSHATFWWGGPTWRVIEKFFQSYRLVIRVVRRFEIVNESLFDVGMTPTPPEFVGASSSFMPTMPYINATNTLMAGKEMQDAFLPLNFAVLDGTESVCVPPPVAPVTYGHPRICGLANRMYCFGTPILFLPGMTFDVVFQQSADVCEPDICATATVQEQTAGDRFTSSIGPLDCASTFYFPGGSIDLGVVFKGFALWPSAAVDFLKSYVFAGSAQSHILNNVLGTNTWLQGLLNSRDEPNAQNAPLNPGMTARGVLATKPESLPSR